MLLSKIRMEWRSCGQPIRQRVFASLGEYIQRLLTGAVPVDLPTLTRVSVAMANAAALDSESAVQASRPGHVLPASLS
jgi:hypothetical protein